MESSEYLATVEALHGEARQRGLLFQSCVDERLTGRGITLGTLDSRRITSFSSCSYLGLEHHPALVQGVKDAVDRYGTQFSSSRGYVSAPGYEELEALLSELFSGHALVTSSTTVGHQVALPVLCTEKDAIVLDNQVHHSVQMAATLARAGGATVEVVRHREIDRALEAVTRLSRHCRTVWFACDGVYSMYGDLAPLGLLRQLLDAAPNVRLYVDDAHGMSWTGKHGRGSFLQRMPLDERMVLATSLNKAFSAAGGCLVFPSAEEREFVRACGGPMVFSGPVQPPMLGAALASARLHLGSEITGFQEALRLRVELCNALLTEHRLPLLVENETPIFFLRLGLPRVAFAVAERMLAEGYYLSISMYPSVPMRRAGIRLSLTANHDPEEIRGAVLGLSRHVPAVFAEQGVSRQELDELFADAVPAESRSSASCQVAPSSVEMLVSLCATALPGPGTAQDRPFSRTGTEGDPGELRLTQSRTIRDIDRATWDRALGAVGACSWDAMALVEGVFRGHERPEHNWDIHYLLVHRPDGRLLCATFFTRMLNKDDMLMRDEVSRAVEARRRGDPYFLTSEILTMGSGLSEGNHLYLDRSGPWRGALSLVLGAAAREYDRHNAGMLMLRDLPADDPEMDAFLLEQGFVKVPMFDSHHLDIDWQDEDGFMNRLSKRQRRHVRERIEQSRGYRREVLGAGWGGRTAGAIGEGELAHLYGLYRNVASRKLRLNIFPLPEALIPALLASPAWEIVTLSLLPEAGGPADGRSVAWAAAHVHDGNYAPFFCGLDYHYVYHHGAYRQLLYQVVRRAEELGMRQVHLGMDADLEKARFGTRVVKNCVCLQVRDHFQGEVLREIVAQVGLDALPWQVKDADHLPRRRDKWFEGARR